MKKIDTLTSLRFIAAFMIVILHLEGQLFIPAGLFKHFRLNQAVSFFFILSGFVLTYAYPRLDTFSGIKQFYVSRLARIWPVHVASIGVLFLMLPVEAEPYSAFLNLSLLHAWIPKREIFFSLNPVSWSVSTEFFFYLVFPFLIYGFKNTWHWKLVMTCSLAFGLIVVCSLLHLPADSASPADVVTKDGLLYINPLSRLFEFTLGMATALLFQKSSWSLSYGRWTLLEAASAGLAVFFLYLTSDAALPQYIRNSGSALAFAFLILVLSFQSGLVSKMLQNRAFVFLGEISYSVYLVHHTMILYFKTLPMNPAFAAFLCVAAVLLLSSLMYLYIEKPGRAFIKSLYVRIMRPQHSRL